MAIKHARVSVGTTATILDTSDTLISQGLVIIQNTGASSVFIGGPGVTTTSYGYELKANTEVKIDRILVSEVLFGIVSAGTVTVNVLMQGS